MAKQRKKLEIDLNVTGKDAEDLAASPNPEEWLKAYLRKKYNLPANVELDLSGLHIGPAQQKSEKE